MINTFVFENKRQKMNIESELEIFKVGNRVFQIGTIDFNNNFIFNLISILDLGLKFVPSFYLNSFQLFSFFLKHIENELINFNKKLCFYKWSLKKNEKFVCLDEPVSLIKIANDNIDIVEENLEENTDINFDHVFKKFEKKKNPLIFRNNHENFEFKYFFYDYLSQIKFSSYYNLTFNQIKTLKEFIKRKPFKVIECDKNVGTCLISNENLDRLCIEHLSNNLIYKKINENPLLETKETVNKELYNLYSNMLISEKIYKILKIEFTVIGKFRILAKIHKDKFGIRPIINSTNTPTYNLCKLVEYILHPYVKKFPSFIQDSQNLIQDLDKKFFPKNIKIISADIEALYTNINLDLALDIITDFARDKLDFNHINIIAFNSILKLIFKNNIFCYNDCFFVQTLGIAMGSVCGPTIANIFVNFLEKSWLSIQKPLYYKRFIDDLFIIYEDDNTFNFENLKKSFLPLNLNLVYGNCVNFLDLEIFVDSYLNKVSFKLYIKKTNTFSYLLTSSNHPKHIFNNIPKSIFIRIKKNCSYDADYYYFSTLVFKQLLKCGYKFKFLLKVLHTVDYINRDDLIPYKNRENNDFNSNNNILFNIPYDFNILLNNDNCKKIKTFFHDNYGFDLKIKFFYSIQNNLGSLLLHNFKFPKIKIYRNTKCSKFNCEICKFISSDAFLILKNGFSLPISCNGNCQSKMAIYIIRCLFCDEIYIGKTEMTIEKRLQVHLSMIKNFFPFKYNCISDISHFNLNGHNYLDHFKFYIFKDNFQSVTELLLVEKYLINFVDKLNKSIMNDYVPFINKSDHQLLFQN